MSLKSNERLVPYDDYLTHYRFGEVKGTPPYHHGLEVETEDPVNEHYRFKKDKHTFGFSSLEGPPGSIFYTDGLRTEQIRKGYEDFMKTHFKEKQMTEREAYRLLHVSSGIQTGDKVKILRSAKTAECGWDEEWLPEKEAHIGDIGTVTGNSYRFGFEITFPESSDVCALRYPFFVLEVVEKASSPSLPPQIGEILYQADFGCQDDHVEDLVREIIKYVDSKVLGEYK